ncbi:hypothetical protein Ddc_08726 [Ditylenchus destructor]|nr:hypothetical protein Ddc_08726 [Ditylenchus destructor]
MNMGTEVLYSDDFCELTDEMLKIKKYFFPTLRAKLLQVRDIRVVYFEAQKDAKYAQRRTWGLAKNAVHWAADFSRCIPGEKLGKTDIIIDVEDGIKKGFTVSDADSFLSALRNVAPISLIIVDNLSIQ